MTLEEFKKLKVDDVLFSRIPEPNLLNKKIKIISINRTTKIPSAFLVEDANGCWSLDSRGFVKGDHEHLERLVDKKNHLPVRIFGELK